MEFIDGDIEGVFVHPLTKHIDDRGFLSETFRIDTLPEGLRPVMSYVSYTKPGLGRGPHEHRDQTDVFALIGPGNFKIYLWDNRKKSTTYGKRMILSGGVDNPITLVVAPGVIHGYRNVSSSELGMVINYPDKLYAGWDKQEPVDEIRHEDEEGFFYREFIQ